MIQYPENPKLNDIEFFHVQPSNIILLRVMCLDPIYDHISCTKKKKLFATSRPPTNAACSGERISCKTMRHRVTSNVEINMLRIGKYLLDLRSIFL